MDTFGSNLKRARARKRLSLRKLGKLAGCNFSYLHDLEHDRSSVSLEKAVTLAEVLGVTVDELARGERDA